MIIIIDIANHDMTQKMLIKANMLCVCLMGNQKYLSDRATIAFTIQETPKTQRKIA